MRTFRARLIVPLVFMLAYSSSGIAQERPAVNPSVLAQTVAGQVATQDADRAAIREVLTRPDVRDAATKSGIDMDRVVASAGTLSGDSLAQVAAAARQVDQSLVGGASTVVISSTTIIIALLLVILIIVAV